MLEAPTREVLEKRPTAQRILQGGVIENNGYYQQDYPLFIDLLLHKEVIESEHHGSCYDFISLTNAAHSLMGLDRKFNLGGEPGTICPHALHTRILATMAPWSINIVKVACFTPHDNYRAMLRRFRLEQLNVIEALEILS